MIQYILAFLGGGIITVSVVALEVNGFALLSRLAALFPVTTWISYFFIADSIGGDEVVSKHSLFVLLGTLVAWVPYMFVISYFSPRIGAHRAIGLAIITFIVLALLFAAVYKK